MRSRCVQGDRGAAVLRPDQAIREASVVALCRTAFPNRRFGGYRTARTRRPTFHAKEKKRWRAERRPRIAGFRTTALASRIMSFGGDGGRRCSIEMLRRAAPSRSRSTIRHALDAPLREMTKRVFTRLCSPTQRAEKANRPRLAAPCSARAGAHARPGCSPTTMAPMNAKVSCQPWDDAPMWARPRVA